MSNLKLKLVLIFTFVLIMSAQTFAQEKLSLTIEQAIETGLQNSKSLHASLMKVKSA